MGPREGRRALWTGAFACLLGLAMLGPAAGVASAQARASRALRAVEVVETETGWDVEILLDFTARYLRQVPEGNGTMIRILIEPLDLGTVQRLGGPFREILPLPGAAVDLLPALEEIAYDQRRLEESWIEIQLSERLDYEVRQGKDLRRIRIRFRRPEGAVRPAGEALPPPPPTADETSGASKAAQMLDRARLAIRDGELDLATSLLTRLLEDESLPAPIALRQDARELLGVTRERRGQLAHARAEYERYLEDYPDGEGAERVRQRLDALVTAASQPSPGLRKAAPRRRQASTRIADVPVEYDLFGSVGVRYFRTDTLLPDEDGGFLASDVLTDFDLASRVDAGDYRVRTDFTGTYDADLTDTGRTDDLRISRLSLLIEDEVRGLELTLGRQRRSDSGVLGRFDGAHLSARLGAHLTVSALAGMPVLSTSDSKPNTDTVLGGGAISVEGLGLDGLRGQIFAVGQRTASMTDRAAIGGDIRYSHPKAYSFLYVDYDVVFQSLNTAVLSSAYYWRPSTDFRILVERRNTPILQLQTALQGQSLRDLDDLRRFVSEDDLRQLAEDRTQVIWTGSAGVTHRPTDRLQLSADATVAHSSSSEDVLDVQSGLQIPGAQSIGPDYSGSLQLLLNDWLIENGVGQVSTRYFEGQTSRAFSIYGFSRFPMPGNIRVNPRVYWEWRDSEVQAARSTLRPSLEIDWRWRSWRLQTQGGIEWVESLGGTQDRNTSYFVEVGGRWEF